MASHDKKINLMNDAPGRGSAWSRWWAVVKVNTYGKLTVQKIMC